MVGRADEIPFILAILGVDDNHDVSTANSGHGGFNRAKRDRHDVNIRGEFGFFDLNRRLDPTRRISPRGNVDETESRAIWYLLLTAARRKNEGRPTGGPIRRDKLGIKGLFTATAQPPRISL
jgi:hypothetical protein